MIFSNYVNSVFNDFKFNLERIKRKLNCRPIGKLESNKPNYKKKIPGALFTKRRV